MNRLMMLVLLVTMISCQQTSDGELVNLGYASDNFEEMIDMPAEEPTETIVEAGFERKLIKNAQIEFEAKDLKAAANRLRVLTNQYGGFVSDERREELYNRHTTNLQIKVPSEQFDQLLDGISKGVEKFDLMQINTQDVTEEYMDLEARFATKKKVEQRYLEILAKAKGIEEILQVEAQVAKVRETIERAEGRIRYLSSKASMSVLNVTVYEVIPIASPEQKNTFLASLAKGFKSGINIVEGFVIGLVTIWPLVVVVVLLIFIYRKRIRKPKLVG